MKRRLLIAAAPVTALAAATARAAAPVTITLWHAMAGALGQKLQATVDAFNKSQTAYQVDAVYKGTYPQVLTATIAAWRAGKAPSIAQVFDVGTADMLGAGRAVVDVYKLAAMTGVAIDPATYIPAVRGYYSLNDGKMGAAPFNSSTATMWINEDVFEKAGLDPKMSLATWDDVIKAARAIKARNAAPIPVMTSWPTWVHFEQFAAIHNVEYATLNDGFGGPKPTLKIDTAPFVKNLGTILSMQKEGLFKYQGRDGAPSPIFYAGKAGITFDSSSIYGQLKQSAKFKFNDTYLPYHPSIIKSPINSIIGGAAFWAMTAPDRTKPEYTAVAHFFNFISQPGNDSGWSEATGYIPVTTAGNALITKQGFYTANPGTNIAVEQLTRTQPTNFSRGIRLGGMPEVRVIIEEEWERAIQNNTPAKTALATAQHRAQAVINRFAQSIHA
ncbi:MULTISPECIES: extracellular solute-binding protein [Acidiphilium]|uniref:sn-glycerol-3-phosphate-binding periplasmic protein UgpB n=1 Tax=Acidiphilium rubrum TaxID=526 RepID=A0A8G2CHX4_ACIRU|nr:MULTISPECIES: extracellular solute-binding protein [Acidiphilium]SIQ15606.1 sn-glycerol 3-phosphate transport system substrate-binding protein [Acidiphilium rubrum]